MAKATQADVTKHPTMLLNEKRPGLVYDLISETRDAYKHSTFIMKVTVDGVEYTGQGKFALHFIGLEEDCASELGINFGIL